MQGAAGRGSQGVIRENFGLEGEPIVAVPTGAAGLVITGPSKQGQTFIIKTFSRVANVSGLARTVSFYLVSRLTGTATLSNCIGLNMAIPADQWMPFGEFYLPYGYDIYGIASGANVNLAACILKED